MNKSNCTYKHINLFRKQSKSAAIDVLDYSYDGNQLTKVDDAGTNEGFKDGDNAGIDYEYDDNGNMSIDRNKEIEDIDYNFLNLPRVITFNPKDGVTRKIEYIYDAAGIKLAQRVYKDAAQSPTKTTDYIGERVYEQKPDDTEPQLQFIHHEEGRIVKDTDPNSTEEWDYQYYLKDHLGNTRLTFGEEKTEEYILTMEVETPANRLIEAEQFENVNITEDQKLPDLNHTPVTSETPSPEYTALLNGSTRIIGPGKSLKVLPGDEVEMSVYAKYLHADGGYDPSVGGNLLLSGFSGAFVDVGGEMLKAKGYVDEGLLTGLENLANNGNDYAGVPQAYLNYILFDKEYNVIEGKKLQISEAGKFTVGNETLGDHEHLQIDPITISEEGYIYIYLSNQTPDSKVYFDDLYIKHTQSRVIQKEDYYSFGLSIAELSTTRENIVDQKFKFQGQEHQTDFGLNWYAFKWRNHQPDIGRFFNVDPLADKYIYNSPYAFSENKVVAHVELEGLEAMPFGLYLDLVNWAVGKAEQKMEEAGLSEQEKKVVRKNPVAGYKSRENFIKAYNLSNALYDQGKIEGPRQGAGNALRHSLWSALNVQTGGAQFAREIGVAHEEGSPDKDPNQEIIDLANNELGISVGLENPDASFEDLAKILLDKIADGEALVIDLENNTVTKSKIDSKDKQKAQDAVEKTYISDDRITDDGDGSN